MVDDDKSLIEDFDPFAERNRLFAIGAVRDPIPHIRELEQTGSVHAGSLSGLFGQVDPYSAYFSEEQSLTALGWRAVETGFSNAEKFSNRLRAAAVGNVMGRTILEMDPPEHTRYRSLLREVFSKKQMARREDTWFREPILEVLEPLASRGGGDLAVEFAFSYPIRIIARAIGLSVEDIDDFYRVASMITTLSAPLDLRQQAAAHVESMVLPLIEQRRAAPTDDLLGVLCAAEVTEEGVTTHLTDEEIVSFVRLLVPAGAHTTYGAQVNLLFGLLTHPGQLDAIREDRSLIPQAIEEALRWEAPLTTIVRLATESTELVGCPVAKGSAVHLCLHSANRDETRWTDPDRFDIARPFKANMAWGHGAHICLGAHFARTELRIALEEVLDRLPNLRLDAGDSDVHIDGLTSRKAVSLPCVWDV